MEDEILLIVWIFTMCVGKENRVKNCLIPLKGKNTGLGNSKTWFLLLDQSLKS